MKSEGYALCHRLFLVSLIAIHELFEVALGAIGGLVAIGLVFHAVRCYILRSHWQAYAASLLGNDGIQLDEPKAAILQPNAVRSDAQSFTVPIVDEETSIRIGLPPAPDDDEEEEEERAAADHDSDAHSAAGSSERHAQEPTSGLAPTAADGSSQPERPLDGESATLVSDGRSQPPSESTPAG